MQEKIEQLQKQIEGKNKEIEDMKTRSTVDEDENAKSQTVHSFGQLTHSTTL